ncbi:MAG: alpha-glucosidase/alpha-galactosidase, partial [Dermatophilaceae bacterium]
MTRICFVGAGSVVFTTQLLRDLLSYDDLGELHIALHDIDADRLETARLTAEQVARRLGRPVGLSAHTDRRAALEGVDVAITMFQVGGLAATKIDFEVPA